MISPAGKPNRRSGRIYALWGDGSSAHLPRSELAGLFRPGDVVVANDAATLPAGLFGVHTETGAPVEVRLAAWHSLGDLAELTAVVFGAGDHRTPTEHRPQPPDFHDGDKFSFGSLDADVKRVLKHPRLISIRFQAERQEVLTELARIGHLVQYAHVPKRLCLWDAWTSIAGPPIAFEAPSAGFALNWSILLNWQRRNVHFVTLSHASGLSTTGDAWLDKSLPFDEPYVISGETAGAVNAARREGRRIIAIGTSTVRALEAAAACGEKVTAGAGMARNKITAQTSLRIADMILTGVHGPDESHFDLLKAFTDEASLIAALKVVGAARYRSHEFGDNMLIERKNGRR